MHWTLSRGTIAVGFFFLGISVFSQSGKSSILGKMFKKNLKKKKKTIISWKI
jgi:hypothetical protein